MKLVKDESYQRKERKFFKKHADLVDKYVDVLKKLKSDPFEPSLKTHKLNGKMREFYASSLTHEYRIVCITSLLTTGTSFAMKNEFKKTSKPISNPKATLHRKFVFLLFH